LTVSDVLKPGEFESIAPPPHEAAPTVPKRAPVPVVTVEMPSLRGQRLVALIAFGVLLVGSLGIAVALRGLASRTRLPHPDQPPVETDRHRVKR
jgi:hypothetical protein